MPSRLPCPVHSGMATRKPPAGKAAAPERPVIRFRDIVRSELIKFRSTRPGPLIVAASLVADADTGMLFGQVLGSNQGG